MDILIPAVIITAVVLASIRKFKPELWMQIKLKFKKKPVKKSKKK